MRGVRITSDAVNSIWSKQIGTPLACLFRMVVLEDERTALADEKVHGTMTLTIVGCPLPDMLSEDIDTTFAYARSRSRHALVLKSL